MNIALILSGGTGTRMGIKIPKQYIEVQGKPVIAYTLDVFCRMDEIDGIQVVAEESRRKEIEKWAGEKLRGFSSPGKNRQLSIYNGLKDILKYASFSDKVIVHDAVRPCVTGKMIADCLDALDFHEGVLPVLPMKDTVYVGENGKVISLLDRNRLLAGQAPEGFLLGKYYEANRLLLPDKILKINGSTEPAVMAGMDIIYTEGDEMNFKITTKTDLQRFERMIKQGE